MLRDQSPGSGWGEPGGRFPSPFSTPPSKRVKTVLPRGDHNADYLFRVFLNRGGGGTEWMSGKMPAPVWYKSEGKHDFDDLFMACRGTV